MSDGPHREPTPPDEQIIEALMTLPCEVIALACVERFNFHRFQLEVDTYLSEAMGLNEEGCDDSGLIRILETLKQDLDRTRFLAPGVLKERMKQELTKKVLTKC